PDAAQATLDATREQRRRSRERLHDEHDPVASRGQIAQRLCEAAAAHAAPVEIVDPFVEGAFDRSSRHSVRCAYAEGRDKQTRASQSARLERHHYFLARAVEGGVIPFARM